jgi:putative Holliday junction resolvase
MNFDFKEYKVRLAASGSRALGLDYGDVNIGLAMSDAGLVLATPYAQIGNKSYRELFPELARIVKWERVGLLVLGLPLEMSGKEGAAAAKVRAFAEAMSPYLPDVDIVFIDERLTSSMAEKSLVRDFDMSREKRRLVLDKLSAARILQQFLDMMNNS